MLFLFARRRVDRAAHLFEALIFQTVLEQSPRKHYCLRTVLSAISRTLSTSAVLRKIMSPNIPPPQKSLRQLSRAIASQCERELSITADKAQNPQFGPSPAARRRASASPCQGEATKSVALVS